MSDQPKRYRLTVTVDADSFEDVSEALREVVYRLDLFEDTARTGGHEDNYRCHSADYEFRLAVQL